MTDNIPLEVIRTSGHSADTMSYRIGDMVFIGDAVPVKGDIPIFINVEETKNTLKILEKLPEIKLFYPAWDQTYSPEMMRRKIADAREIVNRLEKIVSKLDNGMDISELVDLVCDNLNMPMLKTNPLFARTVECCRRGRA